MAELKTKPTELSVEQLIATVEPQQKRDDSAVLIQIMTDITKSEPVIWGKDIIGFGETHYKYASGREGDWFQMGFSPRKKAFSIYTLKYFDETNEIFSRLGKFTHGKSCIYIKKLSDIDLDALKQMLIESIQ